MKEKKENFDTMCNSAVQDQLSGKPMFGSDGVFRQPIERIINVALSTEIECHIDESRSSEQNRRNGQMRKNVRSRYDTLEVTTPCDRNSTFDPQLIKKREVMLADGMADSILGLYARGVSGRDISTFVEEQTGGSISAETNGDRTQAVHHFDYSKETNKTLIDKSIRARKETIKNMER